MQTKEIRDVIGAMHDISNGIPIRHAWVFDKTQKVDDAPFPPEALLETRFGTYYVAPFVNGRLMTWHEAKQQVAPATRRPFVFLDSNMLTRLREVLVDGHKEPEKVSAVLHLIQHCHIWRADTQALPYLREIALRNSLFEKEADAKRAIQAILRLQAVDVEISIASDSIVEDPSYPPKLKALFGSESIVEAAEAIFAEMARKDNGLPGDMVSTYTLLLMMIDLGLDKKKTLGQKLKQTDDFVREVIINSQPRLDVIARLFFGNKFGRLLKVAPGNPAFKRQAFIGAIYDLNLAALHEQFLGLSTPPLADLTILCTADKALARFARCFCIRGLGVFDDRSFRMLNEWNDPLLIDILGEKLWQSASEAADKRDVARMQQGNDHDRIIGYMREFENQLKIEPYDRLVPEGAEGNIAWLRTIEE